jgi:hypothetical protein
LATACPFHGQNSQADKWRKSIDKKLPTWVKNKALATISKHIEATSVDVKVSVEGTNIYIDYDPLAQGTGYVAPRVTLEFGARSTGEPCEERMITCDAAAHLPDLAFPTATPKVMLPKRTFWEKATAVHVFCGQDADGDRYSRHWHDLVRLDEAGHAQAALDDDVLAKEVAEHMSRFFREKDKNGTWVDYAAAVSGGLKLVPEGEALKRLEADYKKMAEDGVLLDDAEPFPGLIERCAELEKRANTRK